MCLAGSLFSNERIALWWRFSSLFPYLTVESKQMIDGGLHPTVETEFPQNMLWTVGLCQKFEKKKSCFGREKRASQERMKRPILEKKSTFTEWHSSLWNSALLLKAQGNSIQKPLWVLERMEQMVGGLKAWHSDKCCREKKLRSDICSYEKPPKVVWWMK